MSDVDASRFIYSIPLEREHRQALVQGSSHVRNCLIGIHRQASRYHSFAVRSALYLSSPYLPHSSQDLAISSSSTNSNPMMASFMSYFGAGRKDPKQTARDAIVGLRQQLQMIEKKEEYLQKKIEEETKKARANAVSNKAGTSSHLLPSFQATTSRRLFIVLVGLRAQSEYYLIDECPFLHHISVLEPSSPTTTRLDFNWRLIYSGYCGAKAKEGDRARAGSTSRKPVTTRDASEYSRVGEP